MGVLVLRGNDFHDVDSDVSGIAGGVNAGDNLEIESTLHSTKGATSIEAAGGKVKIGGSTSQIAFFGATPVAKTSVADMGALSTIETAGATYTATEQTMLNNLKADVTALRTKLNTLLDALQGYNIA